MMKSNQWVTGIVAGVALGAALGLLFAPKTGKETRQIVGMKTNAVRTKAGDYITSIRNKMKKAGEVETLNGAAHQEEAAL
ncbi:MAG: hypothetical protein BZY88_02515 [SAR202 cluster bacterium Io17-Chloro-G9]|nr:MAG: hypothetical protein BZY88_02515 [SAR202 cluster bacterium Io17-Chloro-G9]